MSFILDALRKSEAERQRQSGPGLADAGYRPPARRRGLWLPLLVVVLVANLILMGVFWLRGRDAQAPAPAAAAPVAATGAAPAPIQPGATASRAAPEDADYQAMADAPALDDGLADPAPVAAAAEPLTGPAPGPAAPDNPPGFVTDSLPTAGQLIATGALAAQPMHLDIHVFSTAPAERFVFINMRKYTEGAQLPEGPRVEEITSDGVVLTQDGQRFVLNRD